MVEYAEEVWKDVVGYEGRYKVSSLGRVLSVKRFKAGEKILVQSVGKNGYSKVGLYVDSIHKNNTVHRLVATAFLEDNGNKFVNHIDGNKTNNRLENLEWCSQSDNQKHAFATGLQKVNLTVAREAAWRKTRKEIKQYTLEHEFVKDYISVSEASKETGISRAAISQCLIGNSTRSGGFLWEYKSNKGDSTVGGKRVSCLTT